MGKAVADKVISIPCRSLQGFFEQWFNMLKPIHKLSNKEIILISTIARFRHELSEKITDVRLLDEYLMNPETKKKIREACGMTQQSFQVSMCKLKKNKVIVDNRINQRLLPDLTRSDYKLLLYFNLNLEKDGQLQV